MLNIVVARFPIYLHDIGDLDLSMTLTFPLTFHHWSMHSHHTSLYIKFGKSMLNIVAARASKWLHVLCDLNLSMTLIFPWPFSNGQRSAITQVYISSLVTLYWTLWLLGPIEVGQNPYTLLWDDHWMTTMTPKMTTGHHQNWISFKLAHFWSILKIPLKSVSNFLSYVANKQTNRQANRQTDRQTNEGKNITSLEE